MELHDKVAMVASPFSAFVYSFLAVVLLAPLIVRRIRGRRTLGPVSDSTSRPKTLTK